MSRSRPLGLIVVSLCATVAALSQSAASGTLSLALRAHVQTEQFQIVSSVRGLPLGVRDRMQSLFGSVMLDIADPGAEFQKSGTPGNAALPLRRLIAAGCSADHHCLVYYERGGPTLTRRVALFHWTPADTRFEWGGMAPGGLATIDAARKAIVAGAIKGGDAERW